MDAQPRLEATGALCALVQALARLELEEGYAPNELVDAQEVLAENRFLAARDGVAAELIDPVRARRVPLAEVLADVLAAATAPHACALGAADELAAVPALVAAPEAARQEAHAAAGGIPGLVSALARRFNVAGGQEAVLGQHLLRVDELARREALLELQPGQRLDERAQRARRL